MMVYDSLCSVIVRMIFICIISRNLILNIKWKHLLSNCDYYSKLCVYGTLLLFCLIMNIDTLILKNNEVTFLIFFTLFKNKITIKLLMNN